MGALASPSGLVLVIRSKEDALARVLLCSLVCVSVTLRYLTAVLIAVWHFYLGLHFRRKDSNTDADPNQFPRNIEST